MKRWLTGLFLCAVLLAGVSTPAQAFDTASPVLGRIVESGEFRVGMSGTQPPFCIKSKEGKIIGFEVDLATLLSRAMGVKLTIVEKPFPELLDALQKGEVDAVMSGMTMTPRRNLRAAFVGPYLVSGKSILTRNKTLADISKAEQIDQTGLTVVALANSTGEAFVKSVAPKVELVTTPDYDSGIKMVLEDKAHAMVADYPICALSVMRYPDKGLATTQTPLTIEPIGMAVQPGDSLMLNMIENYLGALEATGILEQLELKWFNDSGWLIQIP